jgi:hypothetical protein
MDGALGAAGTSAAAIGLAKLSGAAFSTPACRRWAVAPSLRGWCLASGTRALESLRADQHADVEQDR